MGTKLRVLVIDDSPEDQELLRRCLRQCMGDEVQASYQDDAESALTSFQAFAPDIVLLDYLLPDLDGIGVVRELKQNYGPNVRPDLARPGKISHASGQLTSGMGALPPIIMLTGQGSEQVAVEALQEGVTDYLVKADLTASALHRTIRQALGRHGLQRSLKQAEERFRAAVETMLDSFGTYVAQRDEQGRIVGFRTEYINAAACDRNNVAMSQKSENLYVIEPPRWTDELFQEYCELVETGIPLAKEVIIHNPEVLDQSDPAIIQRAYDLRATRLGDGFVAVWREITGKKQAELERVRLLRQEQEARATAEEANQLKDILLAIVTHDLRTPLNSILGWVQMLQRNPTEKVMKQAIEVIERSAHSQLSLIGDLLDLSRILRGSLTISLQRMNLLILLDSMIQVFYPLFQENEIQFVLNYVGEIISFNEVELLRQHIKTQAPLFIQGDLNRLNQALSNTLSNAIKFTPKGGKICLGLEFSEGQVRIFVQDSGIGIEPELLTLIFEPFRQQDQKRRGKGLGLGLAIARNIVELHGGDLWAESEGLGQGATFTIQLPLTDA